MRKLTASLLSLIGVVLLVATVIPVPYKLHLILTASRAEGKVVVILAGRRGSATPKIQFTPVGGRPIEVSGDESIDYGRPGDRVPLLYIKDPENSAKYKLYIDTIGALWFDQFVGTCLGMSFILGGLFMKYGSKLKP